MRLYYFLIFTASFFNKKAKLWISGRRNIFSIIRKSGVSNTKNIWFHVSSLGEFEQGRPIIEKIKSQYPDFKIVLTFFSPSGYEIRKNYNKADYIFYLPLDTKNNAVNFIKIINPICVFFVKYDFWYNYLNTLSKQNIPTFLISALFRENQIFFRWYGNWYKKILYFFTKIFVQNKISLDILDRNNVHNHIIAGDTRLDRVFEISQSVKNFDIIEKFKSDKFTIVFGSSWEPDENIITNFINLSNNELKYIIAPHEIHKEHISKLIKLLSKKYLLYSEAANSSFKDINVLIIDNIGMLSSIYRYAEIAYIGGGFGAGIHNIQEPATWGLPIVFGPKYKKFQEAVDLIVQGGAFTIKSEDEFNLIIEKLIYDSDFRQNSGLNSKKYIADNKGATEIIFKEFEKIILH